MVCSVLDLVERLERDPPPLAGSGYEWIADGGGAASERSANAAFVASLDLAIGETGGGDLEKLLADVVEPAARRSADDTAPGYMAYVPGGGLFHGAVGALLGAALNRYVTIDAAAPALAAIERETVDWLGATVAGYGDGRGGVLTSGGSIANLVGLHAARRARVGNADLARATVYASASAHYCVRRRGRRRGGLERTCNARVLRYRLLQRKHPHLGDPKEG